MNPILYMFPGACSRVTMTAFEEIGIDYELRAVDLLSNGQKSPEYKAVNPKGKVPALTLDGQLMTENAAILFFLAQRHPEAGLLPRSEDPIKNNQGLADLIWCASTLHPIARQIRNPQRWTKGETEGIKADGLEKLAAECEALSKRLSDQAWWYGAQWSIVDTYIYWALSAATKGGFPIADYPVVADHTARVRARPSFQRALAKEIEMIASAGLGVDPASL